MEITQKKKLIRLIISVCLLIIAEFLPLPHYAAILLCLVAYLASGAEVLFRVFDNIRHLKAPDENFLMAVSSIGAAVIAAITKSGEYTEAVAVMLLFGVGELLEDYASAKTRTGISALSAVRPDVAYMISGGEKKALSPADVPVGSTVEVSPGERIPIDGTVTDGVSSCDTSAVTGESYPRNISAGDSVYSGCINLSGVIRIRTEKSAGESTIEKILALAEASAEKKSRQERFIARFAAVYTPAVCALAVATATLPPALGALLRFDAHLLKWIYRGLTLLVISCPCALVISIPLTFFACLGGAGRNGILIKHSEYIEKLSKAGTVVFDKTGTLTRGTFEADEIRAIGTDAETLSRYAASVEKASTHPAAVAIASLAPTAIPADAITEYAGEGTVGTVDGKTVAVGNERLMKRLGIAAELPPIEHTAVFVGINGSLAGYFTLTDKIKDAVRESVSSLRDAGIKKTVMLTGDRHGAAEKIASDAGIDVFFADLTPEDKVKKAESLLSPSESLIYVGDGINDAPVLARADVGIAMGALGSDAAVEAADAVIMDDDLMKVSHIVKKSKKCMLIVKENIVFAISAKAICLLLGAFGIAGMALAVLADVGVMILCVLNSLRALLK